MIYTESLLNRSIHAVQYAAFECYSFFNITVCILTIFNLLNIVFDTDDFFLRYFGSLLEPSQGPCQWTYMYKVLRVLRVDNSWWQTTAIKSILTLQSTNTSLGSEKILLVKVWTVTWVLYNKPHQSRMPLAGCHLLHSNEAPSIGQTGEIDYLSPINCKLSNLYMFRCCFCIMTTWRIHNEI